MANTNQGDNTSFPRLEQSSDSRMISYGIYHNNSAMYPNYDYVLLKYVSFPPSTVIQRDEGFAILTNDVNSMCELIVAQGLAMFYRSPNDPPGLVYSFI